MDEGCGGGSGRREGGREALSPSSHPAVAPFRFSLPEWFLFSLHGQYPLPIVYLDELRYLMYKTNIVDIFHKLQIENR